MVLLCKSAARVDSVAWWKDAVQCETLKDVAVRILSTAPHAAGVERINSMHTLVQTKGRCRLVHERVRDLLYCYVNMRILDEVDGELLDFLAAAMQDAAHDAAVAEEAAKDAAAAGGDCQG